MSTHEIAFAVFVYLVMAVIVYVFAYTEATEFRQEPYRFDWREKNAVWKMCKHDFLEGLRLLRLDFFKIHCPWSKTTSVRYRVQEAHDLLQHMTHEKGWKAEDCHNPANHARIAKDCFCSRTRFWLTEIVRCIYFPLGLVLVLVACIVWIIVNAVTEFKRWVFA